MGTLSNISCGNEYIFFVGRSIYQASTITPMVEAWHITRSGSTCVSQPSTHLHKIFSCVDLHMCQIDRWRYHTCVYAGKLSYLLSFSFQCGISVDTLCWPVLFLLSPCLHALPFMMNPYLPAFQSFPSSSLPTSSTFCHSKGNHIQYWQLYKYSHK